MTPRQHAFKSSLLYFSITTLISSIGNKGKHLKPMEVSQNHFQMNFWQIKSLLRIQHVFGRLATANP
jgi:hypothetical protein